MSFRRGRGMGNGRMQGAREMDGGRGRAGGRDGGPPRGGADRLSNHTSDASMANARIFVGNLPTGDARLNKELLEDNFGQYGRILGISILKGFGFIQYAEEISAEGAIRGAQNVEILSHRLDVKHVRTEGGKPAGPGQPEQGGNFRDRERERSPLRRPREFDMPDMRGGREPDLMMRPGGPQHRDLDNRGPRDFDGREWNARDQRHDQLDPYPSADPYMIERERDPMHQRDQQFYPPANDHRGQFGAGPPVPKGGINMVNEVEIVVTSKMAPLRQYAERIESRVRSLGLAVDVLFPHEDIPLRQVLGDLSTRGTLYGIVLSPINQEHASITLNILFGQPEEHRNMPVEDGFALLSSSFQRYQQQQQRGHGGMERMDPAVEASRTSSAPTTGRNGGNGLLGQQPEPHPSTMQILIDQLQANRQMTALEYDRLVRYLSDRRDRQMMIEDQHQQQPQPGRGGAGLAGSQPSSYHHHGGYGSGGNGQQQADSNPLELQQRILSILSSSAAGGGSGHSGNGPAPVPVPVPAPGAAWGGADVNSSSQQQSGLVPDPNNVQKALDSLIQTGPNILKHYQQQPGSHQQQHGRPGLMQQQGNYYQMGKRF